MDSVNNKGFTLLEVLLVVVLIGALAALSAPIYNSYKIRNDFDIAINTTTQTLYRAQVLAQAVDGDSAWGVYIGTGIITIYKGTSYASRDINYDEEYNIDNSISISGINEINFNKFTGLPQTTGDIILTNINNEVETININAQGTVQY